MASIQTCFLCIESPQSDNFMQSHCNCEFHCNCLQNYILTTNKSDECPQCGAKYFSTGLHIAQNGLELANYPKEAKDFLCVLSAVNENGFAIIHASLKLQKNTEIIKAALTNNPLVINLIKNDLITQKMLLDCVKRGNVDQIYIPQRFEDNYEIALARVSKNGKLINDLSIILQGDYDINLAAVTNNGLALQYIDGPYFTDQKIIETAVNQNGLALEFAAPYAKKIPRIALAALKSNKNAIHFVNDSIKKHKLIKLYV